MNTELMAIEFDPYAAPAIIDKPVPRVQPDTQIYRQGNMLVFHKDTVLPERCVRTNLPTTHKVKRLILKRKRIRIGQICFFLLWLLVNLLMPSRISFPGYSIIQTLLLVLIIYIPSNTVIIKIGLSESESLKQNRLIVLAGFLLLLGTAVLFFYYMEGRFLSSPLGILALSSGLAIVGALVAAYYGYKSQSGKSRCDYIYMNGVCPAYLDEYEQVPNDLAI